MNIKKLVAIVLLLSCLALPLASCKGNGNQFGENPPASDGSNTDGENENTDSEDTGNQGGETEIDKDHDDGENTDSETEIDKDHEDESTGTVAIPDPISYEEYVAMTPEERADYYYSFENYEDFFTWYNAAKAKYDEDHKAPELGGDGEINIGDLIGGN